MFDNRWFENNQRHLLAFVNTIWGRWFFALGEVGLPKGVRVMEVMPNGLSFGWRIVDGRLEKTWMFFTSRRFAVRLAYVQACARRFVGAGLAAKLMQPHPSLGFLPLMALATSTFYPDPDPESTSVDGMVRQSYGAGSGQSWATITGAAGSSAEATSADEIIEIEADSGSNNYKSLRRGIYLFDTAALDDGATVSSATLSIYGNSKADTFTVDINIDINIYSSAPASNTALAAGDFDSLGTTAFSTAITYGGFSTSGYNDFVLNASGLAAITKTGVSKFGARNANYDVAGSGPSWESNKIAVLKGYWAEQTGTGNDPKLVVVTSTAYSQTETSTLTLTSSPVFSSIKVLLETLSLSSALTAARVAYVEALETLSLTASFVRSTIKDVSETLTLTSARVLASIKDITEALTLTSALTTLRTAFVTVLDTLNLTSAMRKTLNGAFTIWSNIAKSVASWTAGSKNGTTWTPEDKS